MTAMWFALICHRDLSLKNNRDPNATRIGFATPEIVWHRGVAICAAEET